MKRATHDLSDETHHAPEMTHDTKGFVSKCEIAMKKSKVVYHVLETLSLLTIASFLLL